LRGFSWRASATSNAPRRKGAGDLGAGNAGILIFVGGRERPEYVPWADVERVDLDRPAGVCPPPG
jgi:hypothetical protein